MKTLFRTETTIHGNRVWIEAPTERLAQQAESQINHAFRQVYHLPYKVIGPDGHEHSLETKIEEINAEIWKEKLS